MRNNSQTKQAGHFHALRKQHPRFTYESYSIIRSGDDLKITFNFTLAPNILFAPTTTFKSPDWIRIQNISPMALNNLAFHLGLIEIVSYWKATCAPDIIIKAGSLTSEQIDWWTDLILNGLKEFFFVNDIDFRQHNLFTIKTSEYDPNTSAIYDGPLSSEQELVFFSGGKDSLLSIEFLKENNKKFRCLLLNPSVAASAIANLANNGSPIVVERTIDNNLLELNRRGYLNGHTPFSAYLAFLGVTCAVLYEHSNIITSNERSCEEPATTYLGADVIHQYSKTHEFEEKFHDYAQQYLAPSANFFSLLRPLYELQIVKLFSRYPQHFETFRSCNRNIQKNSWCCQCAKCLFIFVSLYPFMPSSQIIKIFGQDLFERKNLIPLVRKLVGLNGGRPLECIGTINETLAAFYFSLQKAKKTESHLPIMLSYFEANILPLHSKLEETSNKILYGWSHQHGLPDEYRRLLYDSISSI